MNQFQYKKYVSTLLIVVSALIFSEGSFAKVKNVNGEDVSSEEIRVVIIDPWEATPWEAQAFPTAPEGSATTNIVAGRPDDLSNNSKNINSMGLKFNFVYPGHNKVELLPPKEKIVKRNLGQLDDNNKPKIIDVRGIELPGKVLAISTWVLGRGFAYDLECWVQDWKGATHVLNMGSLDFVGWKPLTVKVPGYILQNSDTYPQNRPLLFRKFVIRSTPMSPPGDMVVFFDSLKILTRVYETNFDGADMSFDETDKSEKERMSKYTKDFLSNAD